MMSEMWFILTGLGLMAVAVTAALMLVFWYL